MTTRSNQRMFGLTIATPLMAIAVLAAGQPAAAQAVEPGAPISVQVPYAGLDLNSEAGARIMAQRIKVAASAACGGQVDLRMIYRRQLFEHCRDQTVGRALEELHAPLVTAMAGRSGTVFIAGR